MGLLTDGQINNTEDLRNYENQILDVASSENIDLTGKLALAQDEISTNILTFLLKQSVREVWLFPYLLPRESTRRTVGVSDVVATPQLKRWHATKTLALAYADAYNNQLNDRYAGKWRQYEVLAKGAEQSLYDIGVGLSLDPVPRASAPALGSIQGIGAAATYYIQIAFINRAVQEGSPSYVVSYATSDGTRLMITAINAPPNALGWNVYLGSTPDDLRLQNDLPIPTGSNWILPSSGVRDGRKAGHGQSADRYVLNERVILRG